MAGAGLNLEQQALLDLVVLSKSATFCGFRISSMSIYVSQQRVAHGFHPQSNYWVAATSKDAEADLRTLVKLDNYATFQLPPEEVRPFVL